MPDNSNYEVGYGKPPKSTRFKPGKSGNPNGRPKGSRNFATDLRDVLEMPVPISEGGKRTTMSTQKAALMRLREKALKGDHRALERLLTLALAHDPGEDSKIEQPRLSPEDQAILAGVLKRNGIKRSAETVGDDDE